MSSSKIMTAPGPGAVRRLLVTLGTAAVAGTALLGVGTGPASARDLGGVSMGNACLTQYGSGWHAEVRGSTVMSWACVTSNSVPYPIDVNRECRDEYGMAASATYYDYRNPYSWYCQD